MKQELDIKFEMDEDGNFIFKGTSTYQQNEKTINVSGKLYPQDGTEVLDMFGNFMKGLECYCPSRFNYSTSSPSK
jgi:hypothetical protein